MPRGIMNCEHTAEIRDVTPSARGCEDCLKIGDSWLHLRLCLTCGHVGCCDSSKNKHATTISMRPNTRSSSRSSPMNAGDGVIWMRCLWSEGVKEGMRE